MNPAWITFNSDTGRIELRPDVSVTASSYLYTCVRPLQSGGNLQCVAVVLPQMLTSAQLNGDQIENVLPVDGTLTIDGNLV